MGQEGRVFVDCHMCLFGDSDDGGWNGDNRGDVDSLYVYIGSRHPITSAASWLVRGLWGLGCGVSTFYAPSVLL